MIRYVSGEQPQEALIGNRTANSPTKKPLATAIAGGFCG